MSYDLNKIIEGVVKEALSSGYDDKKNTAVAAKKIAEKKKMTLSLAKKIIEAVQKKAGEIGVKSVCAVCDEGGNLVALERTDDAFAASVDIAVNKAYTSVSLKTDTKKLASLAAPGGSLYGIQFTNGGRIVIFGGGVPLENKEGDIIGGFGVSGGTAEEDTYLGDFAKSFFENMT